MAFDLKKGHDGKVGKHHAKADEGWILARLWKWDGDWQSLSFGSCQQIL
jgi:hypothetical protein